MNKYLCLFALILFGNNLRGQSENNSITINITEAVTIALKNNPEVLSSNWQVTAAAGRYLSGISLPPPTVSLSNEYIQKGQPFTRASEKSISIEQSFAFPLVYVARGNKLAAEEKILQQRSLEVQAAVRAKVKSVYYQVLAVEYQLLTAAEHCKLTEQTTAELEARYKAGEVSHLDYLSARVQHNEALNSRKVIANQLNTLLGELQSLLGYSAVSPVKLILTDSLEYHPVKTDLGTLQKLLEINNPAFRAEGLNVTTAEVNKRLAEYSLLPDISIAYAQQRRDGVGGYYGVSAGISLPLWFLFDNRGKITEASAEHKSAQYQLKSLQNKLMGELMAAVSNLKNDEQQVQLYRTELLPQSEEMYRTAQQSYEAGEISYNEYVQARRTALTTKSNYLLALLGYNLSLVTIEELTGQLPEERN